MNKLFNQLNVVLAAALLITTLFGFAMISGSSRLPAHWDLFGVVDRFAPRNQVLFVLPLFAALAVALLAGVERVIERKATADVSRQFSLVLSVILALFAAIQAMMVLIGMGHSIDVPRIISIVSALGLIAIGNILPKSSPRTVSWPRSLNEPGRQYRLQKITGISMMLGGVVLLVAALTFESSKWLATLQIGCYLVPAVSGALYAAFARSKTP